MILEVAHTTTYTYTGPVVLGPHAFRLRPRTDVGQRLLDFRLDVVPTPVRTDEVVDLDGNSVTHARFEGATSSLRIHAASRVATLREGPILTAAHPSASLGLPVRYPDGLAPTLVPYLGRGGSQGVALLAREVARDAGGELRGFLEGLTARIKQEVRYLVRPEGEPLPPEEVLAKREGACRDLTVLTMEACRAVGLAARFVSGYADAGPAVTQRELHAWAEVYVPGAGWCGYDPTAGRAVGPRHVAVAAGRSNREAAPVEGSFTSAGAQATMEALVEVRVLPGP